MMAVVSQPLHAVEGFRHSLIPHLDTPGSGVLSCVGDEERFVSANVPVLIVGGGPIGLFQAYLLSRLGGKLRFSSKGVKSGIIL